MSVAANTMRCGDPTPDRRELLRAAGGGAAWVALGARHDDSSAAEDRIEAGYDAAMADAQYVFERADGRADHAPMVLEALRFLKRPEHFETLVAEYRARLPFPRLTPAPPLGPTEWRTALGDPARDAAWVAFFEGVLAEGSWEEVLRRWIPRLSPGLVGSAAHGIIRSGHAARALAVRDTSARRRELAMGLAYTAARFTPLPGDPGSAPALRPGGAVAAVPLVDASARHAGGPFPRHVATLGDCEPFGDAVARADVRGDPAEVLGEIAAAGARVYVLADGARFVSLAHAITGPCSLRPLLPHLAPEDAHAVLADAWHAVAALHAMFSPHHVCERDLAVAETWDEIEDRAVAGRDAHAIKLTAACREEERLGGGPVFRAACVDFLGRI